jgi:hypothetical protein
LIQKIDVDVVVARRYAPRQATDNFIEIRKTFDSRSKVPCCHQQLQHFLQLLGLVFIFSYVKLVSMNQNLLRVNWSQFILIEKAFYRLHLRRMRLPTSNANYSMDPFFPCCTEITSFVRITGYEWDLLGSSKGY